MSEIKPKLSGRRYPNCTSLKKGDRRVSVFKHETGNFLVEFKYLREKPKELPTNTLYAHGCLITGLHLSKEAAELLFHSLGDQLGYINVK